MKPTILLWKWRGWRGNEYTQEHVHRTTRMLAKHMSIPYDVVCITDDPYDVDCEVWPIPEPLEGIEGPNCYHRLRVFDKCWGGNFGRKLLSVDLDAVIVGDLAPLLTDDGFKAAAGKHSHICGTLFQLQPGFREDVYHDFDPVESPKLIANTMHGDRQISGSDQAWMSIKMPDAPTWDESDGVYWFKAMKPQRVVPANARFVYFAGGIKPWSKECRMINPALYEAYRE